MLTLALWLLALTVAGGIALACCYLLERPIRGWVRLGAMAHGLAGACGVVLVIALILGGAPDPQGFGHTAAWMLGLTLLGGLLVLAAQLRRRRADRGTPRDDRHGRVRHPARVRLNQPLTLRRPV